MCSVRLKALVSSDCTVTGVDITYYFLDKKLYIYKLKPFVTIVLYSVSYMAFDKFDKGINFVMYCVFSTLIIFITCRFQ